jgi:hypothetical protein
MVRVKGEPLPNDAVRKVLCDLAHSQHLSGHEKHHKAAIGIQRGEALGLGR